MKKLFVFSPVVLLVFFLLNSFVIKEKNAKRKPIKEAKSSAITNIIFKSTDGGQTWQDISEGLPVKLQKEGIRGDGFFANDRGLYLRAGNGVYHSEPNATTAFWTKEIFPGDQRNIVPGKNGILAYNIRGQFLKKINGTSDWSPMYTNFQEQAVRLDSTKDWMYKTYKEREVRTVFETAGGTVLIGSSNSLFRSTNKGKTWKQLHVGNGRMRLVESNGVLLTTSKDGILRSIDDGQNWDRVISEGGLGVAVERIDGGFAAIVNNPTTQRNSIHISMDSGKTWNTIGEDLQPSRASLLMKEIGVLKSLSEILSIKQMGNYLICGRTDGIFRSSDMGKTWTKLLIPAVENFGFNLSVSGNVMYVMPNKGC
ncbi:exo-alpha-sialidase [Dyadobacter chenwenxiniae]|uniref:Exo-alpha-sialidase n=1 Tax=Dyadobacter chenwenxiniae TaxID=2906456 RepID=A0A9X1PPU0_9BACT|nr:exo-alpha-sialidase [Dyadobacter chenwenxiniae]MCF0064711.1 exo-alpha-sialidase [Dyadobacter chenwenxiniae]UON84235.1 exo-alpha-sialidase [Dyadobacter chenwenxiniae]